MSETIDRDRTAVPDRFGLLGRTLDGRYRVESAVAEGGFAVVYRAQHCTLDRPVALKVLKLPEDLTAEGRRRAIEDFLREARLIAALEHPAIARVLDYGTSSVGSEADTPWMALEWIDGETLASLLARAPDPPSPAACLALFRPVFEVLALAHARGIVHRDIKPSNLMLTAAPPGVRVLDFGIAKQMAHGEATPSGETRTRSVSTAFSLHYAAPEQISGTRTGPSTDVHALALVLSETLTGRAPYAGGDAMALYLSVLSTERPTPARRGRDVGAWDPAFARALALMPAERFADAGAFLAALDASSPDSVPDASTDALVVPLRPHVSRRTLAVAGAALVVGAVAWRSMVHVPMARPEARPSIAEPAHRPAAALAATIAPAAAIAPAPPVPAALTVDAVRARPDASAPVATRVSPSRPSVPRASVAAPPPRVTPEPARVPAPVDDGVRGIPEPAPAM